MVSQLQCYWAIIGNMLQTVESYAQSVRDEEMRDALLERVEVIRKLR